MTEEETERIAQATEELNVFLQAIRIKYNVVITTPIINLGT